MNRRAERVGMTADEVLRELKVIGLSDVGHYRVGDPAEPLKVAGDAPADARRAVSSVKRRVRRVVDDDGRVEEIEDVEFRLWSKPEALKLAGQHLKLFDQDGQGARVVVVNVIAPPWAAPPDAAVPVVPVDRQLGSGA